MSEYVAAVDFFEEHRRIHEAQGDTKLAELNRHHLHCVSPPEMARAYARSPGYSVWQDEDEHWHCRKPSGEEFRIRGICDHPEDAQCDMWSGSESRVGHLDELDQPMLIQSEYGG